MRQRHWVRWCISNRQHTPFCIVDVLRFAFNKLLDVGAQSVLYSGVLTQLVHLSLASNELTIESISGVSQQLLATTLTYFDLSGNAIGPAGAAALSGASTTSLKNVSHLKLERCNLALGGVAALFATPGFPKLQYVDLSSNLIGCEGAAILAACERCSNLTHLDLRRTNLGDAGATALATSRRFIGVKRLDLASNHMTQQGTRLLAESAYNFPNLTHLDLSENEVDAGAFASSPHFRRLAHLDLTSCHLRDEDAQTFIHSHSFPCLTSLHLSFPDNDDERNAEIYEALEALKLSRYYPLLTSLRVSFECDLNPFLA